MSEANFFRKRFKAETRARMVWWLTILSAAACVEGWISGMVLGQSPSFTALEVGIIGAALSIWYGVKLAARTRKDKGETSSTVPGRAESRLGVALWFVLAILLVLGKTSEMVALAAIIALLFFWLARQASGVALSSSAKQGSGRRFIEVKSVDSAAGLIVAVIAIVIAYGFGLRAFQIPTGSMEPTLFGKTLSGERAIINLAHYTMTDPQRGDITVFRYPLARGQDYVKRTMASGGETVLIYQGDLYIQGEDDKYPRVWRPEGGLREGLWFEQLPPFSGGAVTYNAKFGGISGEASAKGSVISLKPSEGKAGVFRYPANDAKAPKNSVLRNHDPSAEPDPRRAALHNSENVLDGRARFTLVLSEGATFRFIHNSTEQVTTFVFPAGGKPEASVTRGAERATIAQSSIAIDLAAGEAYEVSAGVANGQVFLEVDGVTFSEALTFAPPIELKLKQRSEAGTLEDYLSLLGGAGIREEARLVDYNRAQAHFEFHAEAGPVEIDALAIDRDIHYLGRRYEEINSDKSEIKLAEGNTLPFVHRVAEDAYFMLGDHSEDSKDSRAWYQVTLAIDERDYRFQLESLVDPEYYGLALVETTQALNAIVSEEEAASLLKRFDEHLRKGKFGATLNCTDIFGIEREISASQITSVKVELVPDVPSSLVVGPLVGSVFPRPRFID